MQNQIDISPFLSTLKTQRGIKPRFHVTKLVAAPLPDTSCLASKPLFEKAESLKNNRCKMADFFSTPSESGRRGKFCGLASTAGRRIQSNRTPWLSRRHTPYVTTPKSGRITRKQDGQTTRSATLRKTTNRQEKENFPTTVVSNGSKRSNARIFQTEGKTSNFFQDIIGKTLRVYQASPLYDFDASSVTTYAEQISGFLQLETDKQLLVGANGEIKNRKYKTDIFVFKDITAEDTKLSAVKVTVNNFTENTSTKVKSTSNPILTMMMCSVEKEASEDTRLQSQFTFLPVCLIKGPADLCRSLIQWFEQKFDCRITPMTFSSTDLCWYFSLWAGMSSAGKSTPIELCYDASTVTGLNRILFSIEEKDAKEIWENIHDKNSFIFTEEESLTFLKALETHFYHHFKINLEGLSVTRVRTAIACIASEGKLKLVHSLYVDHILEQLTQTALTKEFYGRL